VRVVFLHGAGLSSVMWRPQLEALSESLDAVAVDLPGHGSRAAERFSFPAAREVVSAAVAGDGPAVLVGLSLGGYVAMDAAVHDESLAAALVLTGCSVDYSRRGQRIVAWTGEAFQRVWPKRMLREAQRSAFARRYPDLADDLVADHSWRGYADALRAARKVHWYQRIGSYRGPVLVLNGAADTPHVRAQDSLLEHLRSGRAELIEGAGHLANLDRPDEYTAAVRAVAGGSRAGTGHET
jgi:pimeloyl-ACP methyl ester carboxylesterase